MKPTFHPRPPSSDVRHGTRLLHRLNAQMTALEHSRPSSAPPRTTSLDAQARVWRRYRDEWIAAINLLERTERTR